MSDIDNLKDYFKKLQKIINFETVFSFTKFKFVKKSRIDDIMCCIYATLPDSYKKILKTKVNIQRYNSMICYNMLIKLLNKKFILDSNICVINSIEVEKVINTIVKTIERDINSIENPPMG